MVADALLTVHVVMKAAEKATANAVRARIVPNPMPRVAALVNLCKDSLNAAKALF
jgi:hypothetical protein